MGLIIPWNGPALNAAAKLAPSLAAGCSSVLKPAEETPPSALVFRKDPGRAPACRMASSIWSMVMATLPGKHSSIF